MTFHLVAHETIPGTGYVRGQSVTDPLEIAAIKENDGLWKNFSQVPDGTFAASDSSASVPTGPQPEVQSEEHSGRFQQNIP